MKNAMSKMKNTLKGMNRVDKVEDQITDLEDGVVKDN